MSPHHSTRARITFYGGAGERTAAGGKAVRGTLSAHPKYKFGTRVSIPGLKGYSSTFTVQDRGSAVTGRVASRGRTDVFDIFVLNKKERQQLERSTPEYLYATVL